MIKLNASGVGIALLTTGLLGAALVGACAEKKGALMLAINTDMKAPKDVNAVSVTISTNGAIKHSFIGRVTPQGEVLLPATLAIVEPEDKGATIRVRVMAFQDRKPRVLRDVRTTVPSGGRTALLRIPLNFVNDAMVVGPMLPNGIVPDPLPGTAGTTTDGGASGGTTSGDPGTAFGSSAADFDFLGAFQPPCPNIQNDTIIDGECRDSYVDPATLPDFDSAQLGDSRDVGTCFDLAKCFAGAIGVGDTSAPAPSGASKGGTTAAPPSDAPLPAGQGLDAGTPFRDFRPSAITLDRTTCALELNGANPARLNLAIVTPDTGECVRPGECYVPIDRGAAGGWKEESGRVQLPSFVCKLLSGKNLRLAMSSDVCAAKEESNPICTPNAGGVASASPAEAGVSTETGARWMLVEDFPSGIAADPTGTGKVYVVGKNGLSRSPVLTSNAATPPRAQKLLPGDGTDAPRSFGTLSATSLAAYVVTEGSHAYVVRGVAAPQRVDFGAQVVGVTISGPDLLFATAVKSGDAVFRLAAVGDGTATPQPAFTNSTGQAVTAIIALVDAQGSPAGFRLGFESGTIGDCDGTAPCQALARPQTFAGVGRIDAFMPEPSTASTPAPLLLHHTSGLTRLEARAEAFATTTVVSADLSGLTTSAGYYPRGFLVGTTPCVFYADSSNNVRFKNLSTLAEGTIYTGSSAAPVLDVAQLAIGGAGGQPFVLWSVFAAGADGGGVWGAPLPKECPNTHVAPAPGADGGTTPDGGGTLMCPNPAPIDASVLPWSPPAVAAAGTCTQAHLDALVAYVTANPAATFDAMKTFLTAQSAACAGCAFAPDGATWAPFVDGGGGKMMLNYGGCIAIVTANVECGKAWQQLSECSVQACASCATPAAAGACQQSVASPGGVCSTAYGAVVPTCGGVTIANNAGTACSGTYAFEGPIKAQCIGSLP